MARHESNKSRVTPKGTKSTLPSETDTTTPTVRTPVQQGPRPSPTWVPIVMFALLVLGTLLILLNYVVPFPGAPSNWYLLGGLGMVLGGIVAATQYR
jgi:hypothetical protein